MQKQPQWKLKVQEIFQTCSEELKRTTEIGKKMLTASKTNSSLHEAYEELGLLAVKELKSGRLEWDNARVHLLLEEIAEHEKNLDEIEDDVNKIRFAAGPIDVSQSENSKAQSPENLEDSDSGPKEN